MDHLPSRGTPLPCACCVVSTVYANRTVLLFINDVESTRGAGWFHMSWQTLILVDVPKHSCCA